MAKTPAKAPTAKPTGASHVGKPPPKKRVLPKTTADDLIRGVAKVKSEPEEKKDDAPAAAAKPEDPEVTAQAEAARRRLEAEERRMLDFCRRLDAAGGPGSMDMFTMMVFAGSK